jgi:hypothetical protein
VPRVAAIDPFRQRTGIDPATDGQLAALMHWVWCGLNENEKGKRFETRMGTHDLEYVRTTAGRGRPRLTRNLTAALQTVVSWLGPADAALALLIFRLHTHPAFICMPQRNEKVRELLRRVEQRLVQISRKPRFRHLTARDHGIIASLGEGSGHGGEEDERRDSTGECAEGCTGAEKRLAELAQCPLRGEVHPLQEDLHGEGRVSPPPAPLQGRPHILVR